MATQTRLPSIVSVDVSVGTRPWFNPDMFKVKDGQPATSGHNGPAAQTNRVIAKNYGFSVPLGSQITGVSLTIPRNTNRNNGTTNGVDDHEVKLVLDGLPSGNNKASVGKWPIGQSVKVYGGAGDTWGVALTPEVINSPEFGVSYMLSLGGTPLPVSVGVDALEMTVEYI